MQVCMKNYQLDRIGVIVMAGGRGERLKPLTNKTPKPLLKINGTPLLMHVLQYFKKHGLKDISISLNYKSDVFKTTFSKNGFSAFHANLVTEDVPLGSIGVLSKFRRSDNDAFLVYNADIITNMNLHGFIDTFNKHKPDLLMAARHHSFSIPFGVLQVNKKQEVISVIEKPNYSYQFNAGIYLISKDVIDCIPANEFFDIIDLIQLLKKKKMKIMSYPILDYWIDIGTHQDLERANADLSILNL